MIYFRILNIQFSIVDNHYFFRWFISKLALFYKPTHFIFCNLYLYLLMIPTTNTVRALSKVIKYNKIQFTTGNPYNLRWQWKWRPAYYTYPKDTYEHTHVKKPEDTPEVRPLGFTYWQDIISRVVPTFRLYWSRRHRIMDPFQLYVLPSTSFLFYQFWDAAFGFKVLTVLPLCLFYVRMRDKCLDPDIKETYLRDIIHKNAEIGALFKPETIHILDYELEFDQGYPSEAKFPEYKNKLWRFFNSDTMMCTGVFKFGDVESGATMNLKFKTMPTKGPFRYQVGQPYYYYDMRAEITHKGQFKEIVLVDENVELKKHRPFLFMM